MKSLPRGKIILIVLAFLTVLTCFRLIWIHLFSVPDSPRAIGGVVDASNGGSLDQVISLSGEWAFYPDVLLDPESKDHSRNGREIVQVPGPMPVSGEEPYGYGTYRLEIRVPDHNEQYGIHIPKINTSADLYINGVLFSSSGEVGTDRSAHVPSIAPHTVKFMADEDGMIRITIHVANYDEASYGGLVTPIKFGLSDKLDGEQYLSTGVVLLACAIYLLHAIYGLIFYLMSRRLLNDSRLLYFSLGILLMILATLYTENMLFDWLPIDFAWQIKLINCAVLAGGYLVHMLAKQQSPWLGRTRWHRSYSLVLGICAGLVLVTPSEINLSLLPFLAVLILFPNIVAVLVMLQSAVRINRDNLFLCLGMVAAVYSFIWLVIIEALDIEMMSYPFDLVIAIVCFAIYFFKQFFNALSRSKEMTFKLQKVNRMKDRFLVSAAYEMKNPLNEILGISQALAVRERDSLSPATINELKLLDSVGRRMSLMLNDLLDLEKLRDNRFNIRPDAVSPHVIAESVVDMFRFMVADDRLEIINRIPIDFPMVYADEQPLEQILNNLLHNAVKYSQDGKIIVSATEADGWASISVADEGIGIPEELLDRIFEPYQQEQVPDSPYEAGLGIGLNISKQLVELHGGTMDVASRVNQGATFIFTLPLASQEQAIQKVRQKDSAAFASSHQAQPFQADRKRDAELSEDGISISILVVDDDRVNLKVLEAVFASEPYRITTVTSGKEALKLLDAHTWDLVISDIMMPEMSGYELTKKIRETYSMAELPVLLLTAQHNQNSMEAGFLAGANDYVTKPVKVVELYSRVNSLIQLKRSVKERLQMEAAWLQAQIKPHFIINCFLSIAALGRIDLDKMDALINQLTDHIRLSIDFRNSDRLTSIENELKLVRAYLAIQEARFGDRIRVNWDLDEGIGQRSILPLSIQSLVENAVTHGILKRAKGGQLSISIKDREDKLYIAVEDDGVGMTDEQAQNILTGKPGSGIGLMNTDRRLKQWYGQGLHIKSRENIGTAVSFTVPKRHSSVHISK